LTLRTPGSYVPATTGVMMGPNDTAAHPAPAAPAIAQALEGFLTTDELRQFSAIAPASIVGRIGMTWGLILGAIWAWASSGNLAVLAVAFLIVAASQHALFLLAHEGAHYSVARRKWLNDLVSDLCFAGPIFYTTAKYRDGHLPHHTHLGDHAGDLERRTWVLLRGRHLVLLLARTLSGWSALRAILGLTPEKVGARQSPWRWVTCVGLTNGALALYCLAVGAPFAYLWLWFLPLCTITNLLLVLRAVAEHQPLAYAHRESPDESADLTPTLTRTFNPGPLQRFFIAPVGAHHHEHHLFPGVPFANLPRLHATLAARGYFDARDIRESSHLRLLWRLVTIS
jgi:fatty acid desaturase